MTYGDLRRALVQMDIEKVLHLPVIFVCSSSGTTYEVSSAFIRKLTDEHVNSGCYCGPVEDMKAGDKFIELCS